MRSNSRELFFLRRETNSKENAIICNKKIKKMKIATNFEASILQLHVVDL